MIDIIEKYPGFRQAIAEARVYLPPAAREAVAQNKVPKGDLLSFCRSVAMLGAKRTADLLPFCHPITLDYTDLDMTLDGDHLVLTVEVKTIDRTGVEVEAMTAASLAALNAYDMLKPLAEGVEIQAVKLLVKKGGKSHFKEELASFAEPVGVAILVLSDTVAAGKKEDRAGQEIRSVLSLFPAEEKTYEIMPDDAGILRQKIAGFVDDPDVDLIITCGGTGLGPKDLTVQTLRPLLDREIEGVGEWIRQYGGRRTPLATLSNALCGLIGSTLVLALPGSSRGARESMESLYPWFFHLFRVIEKGYRHQTIDNA